LFVEFRLLKLGLVEGIYHRRYGFGRELMADLIVQWGWAFDLEPIRRGSGQE
jgi:hypothetical protein